MSIDISVEIETRLLAAARAEGITIEALVERLIYEREEFAAVSERAASRAGSITLDQMTEKIERGLAESERNEVVDGDEFVNGLLSELDDMEHKRRAG